MSEAAVTTPHNRVEHRLGDVYDFRSGLSKEASAFGSGHPFLTFKDVFYNFFVPDELGDSVNSTVADRDGFDVRRGDVFLTRTSETMEELGMSCVALRDVPFATFNGFTKRLRPKSDAQIVPEFAGYFFRSPQFRREVTAMSSMSTRASLNNEMLSRLRITLPNVGTQAAIGATLKALDDKIKQNLQTARALERLARAIFRAWFVDFEPVKAKAAGATAFPSMPQPVFDALPTRFVDSAVGPVPEGWEVLRLDGLLTLQRGFDLPKQSRTDGSHPILAASGVNGWHSEWRAKGPGVTTGRSGVLGQVYFVDRDFWPLNTSLWVKEYKRSNPWHAYFLLQTLDLAQFNAGSAVPTLNRNHVHSLPIVAPPNNLLAAFGETCGLTFALDQQIRAEVDKLAAMRDYLLPKLLSGQVRVEPQ